MARKPRLISILPLTLIAASVFGSQKPEHEVQAVFRLAGQPTGTYLESKAVNAKGEIETKIDSDLIFNRLGKKLEMKIVTTYRENAAGRFLGSITDLSSSAQSTRIVAIASPSSVSITTSTGGKSYDRSVQFDGVLLAPEAARKFVTASLHKPGDIAEYQTFSPEFGTVTTVKDELVACEPFKIGGDLVPSLKLEQTYSTMPGKSIVWLDDQGWLISQSTPSPFGDIVASRSTAGEGKAASKGSNLPSETFTSSIITSNIRIPNERLIDKIKIKIIHKHPDLGWPDFSATNQRVVSKTRNTVVLEIKRPQLNSSSSRPEKVTLANKTCLTPNALLQSDDPEIQAIVKKVVKNSDDAWTAIRALQKWTNDNMRLDMGVAVAPASEVAKNRKGTCFAYSMLLGSLARAAGIPTKVRVGLVYAGGIWGGHAWVDSLIGDKWIQIDGALYSPGPADAARFSFFASSLEENTLSNLGDWAKMLGNIDIKVLEYSVGGKTVTVAENAKPYSIDGSIYRNPWLGFSISKPAGFHFTSCNVTWPQEILLAMEGPNHQRIEIKDESASLPTGKIATDRSGFIVVRRGEIWTIKSTGPVSKKKLQQVISSIRVSQ